MRNLKITKPEIKEIADLIQREAFIPNRTCAEHLAKQILKAGFRKRVENNETL